MFWQGCPFFPNAILSFFFSFFLFPFIFFPPLDAINPHLFLFSTVLYKLVNITLKRQSDHASKGTRNLLSWQIVNSRMRREGNNVCAYGPVYGIWSDIKILNADCTNIHQDSCTPENHHAMKQVWDVPLGSVLESWLFDLHRANGLNFSFPWDQECKTNFKTLISVMSYSKYLNILVLMHDFQNYEIFYPMVLWHLLRGKTKPPQIFISKRNWYQHIYPVPKSQADPSDPWIYEGIDREFKFLSLVYFGRADVKNASLRKRLTDHSSSPCST